MNTPMVPHGLKNVEKMDLPKSPDLKLLGSLLNELKTTKHPDL